MGIYQASKSLASSWYEGTKRKLAARGRPNTKVDSGGTKESYSFDGQQIDRGELREIRDMRESGGIISHLVHAKAMMQFGTGATFEAENDDAAEWLEDQFNDLDNLLIDIGEDATWFPYSLAEIVETQGGDFSHIELVEPWTVLPIENEVGEIIAWEQQIKGDFGATTETFEPDEIASFVLNKACGRDKTGVSEVLRAEDEITNFKGTQKTVNDALEYLVPHNHWIVGAESQSVIDDNELRRIRNMVDNMQGDTQFITGPDVEHDSIDLPKFDVKEITNNSLRQVCVALGVPIELASVISEGLGSGEQSGVREDYFALEKQAKQRALGGQFIEQIARILLRDYSTYDEDQTLDLVFQESETLDEKKTVVDAIGDDLKVNERRALFDYAELDDEEKGEGFDSPGEESGDDPMGGLFNQNSDGGNLSKNGNEGSNSNETGISLESGTGNVSLAEGSPDWDQHYLDLFERIWSADADKQLVSFSDSATPEFVKERLKEAIRGGAVFHQFDNIPSGELMQLRNYLIEELEDENWNIDGIANRLQDLDGDMSFEQAQTVARTETASTVNTAREIGYKERGRADDEKFFWTGSLDSRVTQACEWLIKTTNPHEGGNPVSLERLKELIKEAPSHDPEMQDDLARPENYVVHPNERKTFVRYVE